MKITITPSKRKRELRITAYKNDEIQPEFPTEITKSYSIESEEIEEIDVLKHPDGDILQIIPIDKEIIEEIFISNKYPNKAKLSKICGHLNNEDKCIAYGPAMDCDYFDKQEDCDAFEEVEWIEDEEESEGLD